MKQQYTKIVLIVAGGKGNRMNSEIPKQFLHIGGQPILLHTVKRFVEYDKQIDLRLVLPETEFVLWKNIIRDYNFTFPHTLFAGGTSRFESVKNGLEGISQNSLVAVHDGVRPFVSQKTIDACFSEAQKYGAAIPVVAMKDSIREQLALTNKPVNRERYVAVQTPQVFQSHLLLKAYETVNHSSFTDDASVVESLGYEIKLVEGSYENIKITTPTDLLIAESFLKAGI